MKLRTQNRVQRNITTLDGKLSFLRSTLIPNGDEAKQALLDLEDSKSIVPMDSALRIDLLPFKYTVSSMLEFTLVAMNAGSYQEAEDIISSRYRPDLSSNMKARNGNQEEPSLINDDTLREITNYIGKMVYLHDRQLAEEARYMFENGLIPQAEDAENGLYLLLDASAFNAIPCPDLQIQSDSFPMDHRLCVAFQKSNIHAEKHFRKNGDEYDTIAVSKAEYVCSNESPEDFKWQILALAIRKGYGTGKRVFIISGGDDWIISMQELLFPDAIHVLDLSLLERKILNSSRLLLGNDNLRSQEWVQLISGMIEAGNWEKAIAEIESFQTTADSGRFHAGLKELCTFIRSRSRMMNYPSFLKHGLIVRSEQIRAGKKTVLRDKLIRPGMRWNECTARYMLTLAAKLQSNLWESSVESYVRRKLIRDKEVPARLPHTGREIEEAEKQDLEEIRKNVAARFASESKKKRK